MRGLFDGILNWCRWNLTNWQSFVHIFDTFSLPFEVLWGVPQGSVVGLLLFSILITDLCNVIKYSKNLLYSDDVKIFRAFFVDLKVLQVLPHGYNSRYRPTLWVLCV